jgi:hypothetical protein
MTVEECVPHHIQEWPGTLSGECWNRVPTALSYEGTGPASVLSNWGFAALKETHKVIRRSFTKLLCLEEEHKAQDNGEVPTMQNLALQWLVKYLECLYQHIKDYFENFWWPAADEWDETAIEFIFCLPECSVGTRCTAHNIENYKASIRKAGFGLRIVHSVTVNMTKAEAVAQCTTECGMSRMLEGSRACEHFKVRFSASSPLELDLV